MWILFSEYTYIFDHFKALLLAIPVLLRLVLAGLVWFAIKDGLWTTSRAIRDFQPDVPGRKSENPQPQARHPTPSAFNPKPSSPKP